MNPVRLGLARALFLLAFVSFQSLAGVISLVVDPISPGTVYAGTAEGGLLKSSDGGASWTRAGLSDTPVFALAIDPGTPSLLYALTSTGLSKSANGGATWTLLLTNGSHPSWGLIERPISWMVGTLALARRADPALPPTVYAGMTYQASDWFNQYIWGDLFTSTDGGERWTGYLADANDPFSSPWMVAPTIAAAPATAPAPAIFYTGGHPGVSGYQVCGIGGCALLDQGSEPPLVLAVHPSNPYVVYAGMNGSGVYKSTDAGATWSGGGTGVVRSLAVDPHASEIVYAGTDDVGVLKSTDGGVTWSPVNTGLTSHLEGLGVHSGIYAVAVDPLVSTTIYAGTAAGVFKSTDGGGVWILTGASQQSSLVSLNLNPAAVTRGETSTGTVTLNSAAPSGGTVITLSSADTVLANVPPSVTVPAGATDASFAISTTQQLSSLTTVKISATLDDAGRSGVLTIAPPLGSLVLGTNRLAGGISATGSVTLGLPAPAGGAVVSLSTSNPAVAAVPASITVTPGATSANFNVSTAAVPVSTTVTITVAYAGDTKSTVLEIVPTTLASLSFNPPGVIPGGTSTGTVMLSVPAPAGGALVTLSSSMSWAATVPASVTVAPGSMSASFTISTNPVLPPQVGAAFVLITAANGGSIISDELMVWRPDFALSALSLDAASVAGGTVSTASAILGAAAREGGAVVTLSSSNPAVAAVPASVTVPAGHWSVSFAVATSIVAVSTPVSIAAISGGAIREVQLLVTPPPSPALSTLSVEPTSVSSGIAATGTATLGAPAPAGGATIALTSSDPGVAKVPGSITVASGALTASFPVTTVACTPGSATVSGTYGGVTRSAAVNVTSSADNVGIDLADYTASKRELRVSARSSHSNATLRVYVTSSGASVGTLRNLGDGRYSGRFSWPVDPQRITVRSTLCGSATALTR